MAKKYLIYNGDDKANFIIRNEFHKFLTKSKFIEDIYGDDETIVEESKEDGEIIQTLKIDLSLSENIKAIWRVNLEKEIDGISTKNYFRTPEIALLVLMSNSDDTYMLQVVFIELKNSLQDSKLKRNSNPTKPPKITKSTIADCHEKFTMAMNRLYLFLSLNEHKNDKFYKDKTVEVQFKGFVVYNDDATSEIENSQLYSILKGTASNNIIDCKTIFGNNDKMKVAFYKNKNTISLNELLTI